MKPQKNILLLVTFMIIILCANKSYSQENVIIVKDYPANHGEPEIDLESHKIGDVEIYRVNYWEEGYEIIYYHDISGNTRDYHFLCVDTTNYNQGFYNWRNDTTVRVRLYNSSTNKEFNIELFLSRGLSSYHGVRLVD